MKSVWLTLTLLVGCGETIYKSAPPLDDATAGTTSMVTTSTTTTESSSSSGATPDECAAYDGCVKAGGDRDTCASVTGVDADACDEARCERLLDQCTDGDRSACAELPDCAPPTTESSTGSSSDTGTSETSETTAQTVGTSTDSGSTSGTGSESSSGSTTTDTGTGGTTT